jgi:hypothetical protein
MHRVNVASHVNAPPSTAFRDMARDRLPTRYSQSFPWVLGIKPDERAMEQKFRWRRWTSAKPLYEEDIMGLGRGALLWLLGVPLPIVLLLALFWHH